MSTTELAVERIKALPEELQIEALHYIEYLQYRRTAEDRDWAELGARELARHYAPADAIYDEE